MDNSKRLKDFLHESGYQHRWLEKQMLMSRATVAAWLSGRSVPQVKHAKKIEEITGGAVPADGWAR